MGLEQCWRAAFFAYFFVLLQKSMVGRQGRRLKNAMDCGREAISARSACIVHVVHAPSHSDNLIFSSPLAARNSSLPLIHLLFINLQLQFSIKFLRRNH
jgi:hypothetical protein